MRGSFKFVEELYGFPIYSDGHQFYVQDRNGYDLQPECLFDTLFDAKEAIEEAD